MIAPAFIAPDVFGEFSALQDRFPSAIIQAFGSDALEAIAAAQLSWQSDSESFQQLFQEWKDEVEQLISTLEFVANSDVEALQLPRVKANQIKAANDFFFTKLIDNAPGLARCHTRRLQFIRRQVVSMADAFGSINDDPAIVSKLINSAGESLAQGMKYFQQDIAGRDVDYHIKRCAEDAFELGTDLATTEGEVVYQNDLFQLIHYRPTQDKVMSVPLLIVPPCINKYYILDLTKELSLVKWLVSQGVDLYLISWVNPTEISKDFDLTDYIELGVGKACSVIAGQLDSKRVHIAGYCIGGLFAALAAANIEINKHIASMSLLNTLLDYQEPGELEVFLSDRMLSALSEIGSKEGLIRGGMLSWAFTLLRERQLLWPYWIRRYIRGEEPPTDPIMYWNQDTANLSSRMMLDYLESFYVENRFFEAENMDKPVLGNKSFSLQNIHAPTYLLACNKDHIVNWQCSLGVSGKISGDVRSVLASGGHVLGVLNPPDNEKPGRYWVMSGDDAQALTQPEIEKAINGSWWNDWMSWLAGLDDTYIVPPNWAQEKQRSIGKAPGSYVSA